MFSGNSGGTTGSMTTVGVGTTGALSPSLRRAKETGPGHPVQLVVMH